MKDSIIVGLLQNTAILLALSYVYEYWWHRNDQPRNNLNKIFTGLIIGIIGVVIMLTPWILIPGLVFDTRSVVLSVSGLFFGNLPTTIAMLITGIFRLYRGGNGMWMGIAVIVLSGTLGMLWNRFRPLRQSKNYGIELIVMGFVVNLLMLGCTIFLPEGSRLDTLKTIAPPVLTIYPLATLLLGSLMFRQYKNWQNRKAAEKLRESERRFSELMKNTFLFSAIIDMQGNIIFCNKSLLEVSGYSFEELSGKNFFDFFIPENRGKKLSMLFRRILLGDESALNFETSFTIRDGSSIMVSFTCTQLKDEEGNVTGIAGIGENITKRKQAETDLIDAKLKAEESDRLKSIFLANMSHEIRTPMNSIMGFSELMGEGDINEPEKSQYIDIIRSSSSRLLQLINDIIDLSKLEAKQLTISNTDCSLSELFLNSTESFRRSELLLKKPDIELVLKFPESYKDVKFVSDCIRVQQVLDNLLSNAIKYTFKGKVETGCVIKSENGIEYIEIYVKDSGIGISREMSSLVFERFRQVEEGRFHEGAGLGLSISKGIVELLGGKIWFTSELNAGSTFYFAFPYVKPDAVQFKTVKPKQQLTMLKGKNIIIAEDDFNSYRYLKLLLRGENVNILHAEDGRALMELVRISIPDLILLDINMPVMSGFEVLEKMQKEGLNTKIIAQTAYAMPDEKERCLNAGCHGYISKPIKKDELFEVINTVLSI